MGDSSLPPKNDVVGFSGKIHPQYQDELDAFIAILKQEGCTSYLEVGCRYGDTFHKVGMALPEGSTLVGVDLPGTKSGSKHPPRQGGHADSDKFLLKARDDLNGHKRQAHIYIGNSRDEKIIEQVRQHAPFDALLIDGDHSEEGTRADWLNYGPMARIVAFHDVCGEGRWNVQIRRVFDDAKNGRRSEVLSRDGIRRGFGVVWT